MVRSARDVGFLEQAWTAVLAIQRDLHRQLAGAVKKLKSDGGLAAAWLLASLSFIYGVVHAVGPGHGKAVISSYVLANERTVRRGIMLSFLAAIVQAVSAICLVVVLAIVLNAAGLTIKATEAHLETASYALIALVGLWLVITQLRRIFAGHAGHAHAHDHDHAHTHGCGHAHDHSCGHVHMPDPQDLAGKLSWRKAAAIVFAVGIRPCSGAVIVLIFALANGLFFAGVVATFAMAIGTAITVSSLAVLAVGSKQLALRLAGDSGNWSGWIMNGAALGGSLLVLMLGVTLFLGSLGPARPF
ncbi:MAG: nickel/cobalt transporter [Hyphomicrobiaceae bacterium]|nr:nickel/cobalt transporter [Hyphomicrobiaceae bacterium]